MIEVIWGDAVPDGCDRALSAILSKLRSLLTRAKLTNCAIHSMGTAVRVNFSADIWIDWETAWADIERATHCCAEGNVGEAYGWALAAYMIAREGLLPGEEAPWLVQKRDQLNSVLMRAIDALIDIYGATGNYDMAVQFAEESVTRDPLREVTYQQLIDNYAALGKISAAMRAYERCCEALSQLRRKPSPAIEETYRRAVTARAPSNPGARENRW
jgi:LuxR family maltose regulon positive regulatory protein